MESKYWSYFEVQVKILSCVENPGILCSCLGWFFLQAVCQCVENVIVLNHLQVSISLSVLFSVYAVLKNKIFPDN